MKVLLSLASFLMFFTLHATPLKVLTYSSLLDHGGLGEEIKKAFPSVEFSSSKDFSGILGTLRRLKRNNQLSTLDVVLGLNEAHYQTAVSEGLIEKGTFYEEASFSILINKEILPKKDWPKSWKEFKEKLAGKVLIQDPRTSEIGLAWLLNATVLENLNLVEAKKIPQQVFPSWSSSFKAFDAKLAPAIWTYSTSVAYYHCNKDKNAANFENLPLPHYPKDKNFIALIKGNKNPDAKKFSTLILSEKIQSQVWQKNWMFPALPLAKPECFKPLWFPEDAKGLGGHTPQELLRWLDQWSL